jgi:AdoMet-dependent heme synthase
VTPPQEHGPALYRHDAAPFLIYWEATRACDLACHHCRAEARSRRHPRELSGADARDLFRQILRFGGPPFPHVVITGGDPLKRPDLFELVAEATRLGLTLSITPAGTPLLERRIVRKLKGAGIQTLALSLDGSTAKRHDAQRGVPGSYGWTLAGARYAAEEGLPLQLNTLVSARTAGDLSDLKALVAQLGVLRWALFFLVATGRARASEELSPPEAEKVLRWLADVAPTLPFSVKTTEAPQYRRILARRRADGIASKASGRGFGVRDANGILFISHTGDVYPSGFLPLSAGNIRDAELVDLYRDSALFTSLRETSRLKGKCGICPYRDLCGGSRARAFAATGDPLESDPLCVYHPPSVKAAALSPVGC